MNSMDQIVLTIARLVADAQNDPATWDSMMVYDMYTDPTVFPCRKQAEIYYCIMNCMKELARCRLMTLGIIPQSFIPADQAWESLPGMTGLY